MLGWEVGELIGKFMHAITHHSKPDGTPYPSEECPIFTVLQKGEIQRVDNEVFWRKDGTGFPVRYASTPIVEQDKVVGAVVTFENITERKRTELKYKTVLGTTMDGFWIADTEGRLLDVNDAACRLTGYSREELLTMRIQDVEDKETQAETAQHIRKITETGYDRFETRHRCKDGKIMDIEVSVNHVKIADGRFLHFFAILPNVRNQKRRFAYNCSASTSCAMLTRSFYPPSIWVLPSKPSWIGHFYNSMLTLLTYFSSILTCRRLSILPGEVSIRLPFSIHGCVSVKVVAVGPPLSVVPSLFTTCVMSRVFAVSNCQGRNHLPLTMWRRSLQRGR